MSTELARAYVTLIPSFKGAQGALARELTGGKALSEADNAGKSLGSRVLGGATKALGLTTAAVGALGAAVGGLAIKGGISRQLNIEDAQAKLRGLGHDTKSVQAIMTDALGAVRGTAFGLDAAATTAAGAIAAGIKPGQQLEGYLRLTADAATIAGISMSEMGSIMNKVQANGRAMTENLNQLSDRGIPILGWLAEEYGVTTEAMSKMVSQGQVDAETFNKVLQENIGGAALQSGATTRGAFANMMAALSRVGVTMTSWFFPLIKDVFNGVTSILDGVNDRVGPWAETFATWFQGTAGPAVASFSDNVLGALDKLFAGINLLATGDFTSQIREALGAEEDSPIVGGLLSVRERALAIFGEVTGGVRAMFAAFRDGGSDVTSGGFAGILETLGLVARAVWDSLGPGLQQLGPQLLTVVQAFSPLGFVLQTVQPILPQVAQALTGIATALGGALAAVLPTVVDLLATLASTLSGALAAVLPTVATLLTSLATTLSGALAQVLPLLADLAVQLVDALAPVLPDIASLLGEVGSVLAGVLSGAVSAILPILVELVGTVFEALRPLLPVIVQLLGAAAKVFGVLMKAVQPLLPPVLLLVQSLMDAFMPLLPTLTKLLTTVATVVVSLLDALSPLLPTLTNLISVGLNVLIAVLTPLINVISVVAEVVLSVLVVALEAIMPIVTRVLGVVAQLAQFLSKVLAVGFEWLAKVVVTVWNAIRSAISTAWNWISTWVFAPMRAGVALVTGAFDLARAGIGKAWDLVKSALKAGWDWVSAYVFTPFKIGISLLGDAFSNVKDAIGEAWDKLKALSAKPVNFILGTVYNDGIREWWNKIAGAVGLTSLQLPKASLVKFATGGVMPGYTPGRDVHKFFSPTAGWLELSGGEAIMRPEWTRAVGGPGAVASMNAAARTGRAFASGGVFGAETGGFPPEWIKAVGRGIASFGKNLWDAGAMAVEIIKDPIGAVKRAVGELVSNAGAGGNAGGLFDIVSELPGRFATGLADKVKAMLGDAERDGAGSNGPAAAALGVARMSQIVRALVPGARITSGLRPGAITATGYPSMHGLGRAIDIAGPTPGDGAAMMAIFNAIKAAFPNSTELIYSPAGLRQLYKGRPYLFPEPTRGMHYDHVHWAMRQGGVLPLFDNGGYLPTGISVVENRSGKPEPVLTDAQWDKLNGTTAGVHVDQIVTADMREAVDELERMQRRSRVRANLVGRV
ncbi:tape measure protein [Cellulosimicrobium funkei]|uniref:tape measure protein n=1 Tax=Cellulosimicrobium funkei TaxID=264251 RepID=UPI003448A5A0